MRRGRLAFLDNALGRRLAGEVTHPKLRAHARPVHQVEQDAVVTLEQVQRRVVFGIRRSHVSAPPAEKVLDGRCVLREDAPVQSGAPGTVGCLDERGVGAEEGAERCRTAVLRRESDRRLAAVLWSARVRAMQEQQVDEHSVPVHARMHECSDARLVSSVDARTLAQQQAAGIHHAGRSRKRKRRVALVCRRVDVLRRELLQARKIAAECGHVHRGGVVSHWTHGGTACAPGCAPTATVPPLELRGRIGSEFSRQRQQAKGRTPDGHSTLWVQLAQTKHQATAHHSESRARRFGDVVSGPRRHSSHALVGCFTSQPRPFETTTAPDRV